MYDLLYTAYGPQGWWPLLEHHGTNPTKTGSMRGYHPRQYQKPSHKQRFEICIGAILTQNTNWINVERALHNLQQSRLLDADNLSAASEQTVQKCIKPAGYFRQKTRKLKEFTAFYKTLRRTPTRDELLTIWGIGPETADSILLYAYHVPVFVVDAYTKRILNHLNIIDKNTSYEHVQALFHTQFPKEVHTYQEYHALLVEHAKRHYSRKPFGKADSLLDQIKPRR